MGKQTIVTISRESGSGGLEVGQKLAALLGVKCYDKEILTEAAKESGFAEEIFKDHDESAKKNFIFSWTMCLGNSGYSMPLSTQLYIAQFNAIRDMAEKGECVFVGRCSDYVLKDAGCNLINIFVHASPEVRAQRVSQRTGKSLEEAAEYNRKTDKDRASYYNYYTDHKWGRIENYDMVIDTGKITIDDTVKLLAEYIRLRKSEE